MTTTVKPQRTLPQDEEATANPERALSAGTAAPDLTLLTTPDQSVSLHEFLGQPIVLVFYPADWSPVCGDQLALYNEILPVFQRYGSQLLGISVDGKWCHHAFAEAHHFLF